jgi:hypothetical protein
MFLLTRFEKEEYMNGNIIKKRSYKINNGKAIISKCKWGGVQFLAGQLLYL